MKLIDKLLLSFYLIFFLIMVIISCSVNVKGYEEPPKKHCSWYIAEEDGVSVLRHHEDCDAEEHAWMWETYEN